MPKLIPFHVRHLSQIDLREFDEQVILGVPDAFERIIQQAKNGVAYTGVDEKGKIILIGGIAFLWEGVGSGWVLTSKLLLEHKTWSHRAIKDVLDITEGTHKLHRIESLILKGHEVSMKWAERLGFKQEGLLRKYDSQKNDYWLCARVK